MVVTKITGICMIENVLLNLILIPTFSYVGASISTLLTEFSVAILLIVIFSRTRYVMDKKDFYIALFKIIMASLLMGIFVLLLRFLNLFILIIISAIFYFIISYLLKLIDQEDFNIITNSFTRLKK